MLSWQTLTSITAPSSSLKRYRLYGARSLDSYRILRAAATLKVPGISPRLRAISTEPIESRSDDVRLTLSDTEDLVPRNENEKEEEEEEEEEEEKPGISRIQVSRQKYIPVSKAELLDAIVSRLFDSQDEGARQFRLLSSCLDSILHAEHKSILEQMRTDYYFSHSAEKERNKMVVSESEVVANGDTSNLTEDSIEPDTWFNYGLDLTNFLSSSARNVRRYSDDKSRVAVATRFQRAFMQLINDAQFEELSVRDLMLTNALNTDYLLTLPIYVDWKRASESNAIIFRRGYATERQKGLLIVEKLDYLQSRLLRGIFSIISKPVAKVGKWISYNLNEALKDASQEEETQNWIGRLKLWLEELSLFQQSYFNNEQNFENVPGIDQLSDCDLPIWLAAQRAISRYEGFLSAVGPRGRLLKKLLARIGLIRPTSETPFQLHSDSSVSEPYLRPTFLSRISLSDIWRPATRKYCGNDVWKMLKTSVSILLSRSVLQEPAFQELILLYTKDFAEEDTEDNTEAQALQLKIYERIPIPDLPVIFPHKRLSFRIIDTVRLDVATILGLLAFFINYKFEDILSSPSAIFLDVVAITALIIYVSRVALGYKQTWDRYQLLVNKTLYEKTLASGFGSVHFLLDASEQQQYKEAILTYAILLNMENGQAACHQKVGEKCERFMYDVFKRKVEMPVDKALNTLVRLGLVTETTVDGRLKLDAVPCPKAYEALKDRWHGLLG
ncbi:uncharacterized protein LOC110414486 [Herrania umbratica]|uniref:Uncharacterized protein LOC110414486 n=1 Tax=Herrania umbratica TaxID=108875 RepID=A0A6J1A2J9_9ROSI|nr:uncharacterized protein LOC110414486 [Herrania umbratica]